MKRTVRSLRCLVVLLFRLVALTGWIAAPDRVRMWLEPTTHAGATFMVDSSADGPGNRIGTDLNGTAAASNSVGIIIDSSSALPNTFGISIFSAGNFIGGTTPAERNVISGNFTTILASGGPTTVI